MREKGVFCCGTMRSYRGEPASYREMKKIFKKQDFICHQKENVNIMMWYDKKVVTFISKFLNFEESITVFIFL